MEEEIPKDEEGSDLSTNYFYFQVGSGWQMKPARVIEESPVQLTVNGVPWLTIMCTPTNLEAMAVGYLYNENVIQSVAEVASVRACEQKTNVDVWLYHPVEKPVRWTRTSGCTGGMTSIPEDECPPDSEIPAVIQRGPIVHPQSLLQAMEQLFQVQELYRETRGVHCSAVSDGQTILLHTEDIGRHNTLDKLAGMLILQSLQLEPFIVLTTGRISSEMLQKSVHMGAGMVVSRTSPTTRSIQLARQMGITLVGYARRVQFVVYAHPERLLQAVNPTVPQWTLKEPSPVPQPGVLPG
jgi:FdhD protein